MVGPTRPAAAALRGLLQRSRAAIVWLVQPLRQPAPTRGFVVAMGLRAAALATTASFLWLTALLVVAAVKVLVDLIVLGAAVAAILFVVFTLFSALGSGGSRRGRRRRRQRRR